MRSGSASSWALGPTHQTAETQADQHARRAALDHPAALEGSGDGSRIRLKLEARLRALGPRVRELADEYLVVLYFKYLDEVSPSSVVEAVAM
jgi:hypothetical protein